ncbi:DeoR/GlpR family DNA-binding transcription regulator [Lachnospiraceae bacterium OttesenSCG-928-D06]|nr:DeoR/GlpR family DNA-binding transcription regulator [Lachnospiraceae bacterium OttesenSCG-928-D06]
MISKLDKRRNEILSILSQIPISSTQQLAEETGVSTETMRKDLDFLAEEGLILKVHGGVALTGGNTAEIPFDLRATKNSAAKKRIAQNAATLIESQDVIVLESCTTNLELAKELVNYPELLESLIIITNSFSIASIFDGGRKCKKMFFLGGWVNPTQYSCRGHQTTITLQEFHVSKAFLSGAALSKDFILSGYYDEDIAFQKAAFHAAHKTVLMIDHSKFDQTAIFSVAPLSDFNYLITDKKLSKEALDYLSTHKVSYIKA